MILAFLALTHLNDKRLAMIEDVKKAEIELLTLDKIKDSTVWGERFLFTQKQLEITQASLWKGATSGEVAAQLQQRLQNLSQKNNLASVQIQVTPETEVLTDIEIMQFSIRALVNDGKTFTHLLEAMIANKNKIHITDISIDFHQKRSSLLRLSGVVPVKLADRNNTDATFNVGQP